MTWKVLIHPLVWKEDLPRLDAGEQRRVLKTIRKKLTIDPQGYGEPLRGELSRYRKLRVFDDYRVVYRVDRVNKTVFILAVGIRRNQEVYKEALKRL